MASIQLIWSCRVFNLTGCVAGMGEETYILNTWEVIAVSLVIGAVVIVGFFFILNAPERWRQRLKRWRKH
ncbi:conserved hypothetical protein [Chelatococcus asaccharovorans]|nr:conserved hypothetical protein [Chelatococcus asaccharovorans]CAH1683145.1 conserved hypothetical protein [Chelatococcus asaccharovorans]